MGQYGWGTDERLPRLERANGLSFAWSFVQWTPVGASCDGRAMPSDSAPAVAGHQPPPAFLGWLRRYDRAVLPADVSAGLTAAAVVLPKAMAYATVASLPVQIGLYAALVPPIIYAALGRSAVLSVSTTTTIGILTGSALSEAVPGANAAGLATAAATLAVLVGLVLLAAALLRFGFVANFISEPVLAG